MRAAVDCLWLTAALLLDVSGPVQTPSRLV